MRNMTVKARIALANIDENQARRKLLEGKRYDIVFYGGWCMVDNKGNYGKIESHETMGEALDAAESANEEK